MIFQVVSPFTTSIYGDSFKEAIKNYIKLNSNLNINQMIVTDQTNHMQANIKYYQQDGRNRVGINMYPLGGLFNTPPVVVVKDKNQENYIPQSINVVEPSPFMPMASMNPFMPFTVSSPMSPMPMMPMPFIPTVVNIPRGI